MTEYDTAMEYELDDYEIKSDFEHEMNALGYDFITNFRVEHEPIYRMAAEECGLDFSIENETHDSWGNRRDYGKAFYVSSDVHDLSEFWQVFDRIKEGADTDGTVSTERSD